MKNNKKIKSKDVMKILRGFIRKEIVGLSNIREDGKMDLRFPNGQIFTIAVEEAKSLDLSARMRI